ncbi:MAG: SRPBCC family protein [Alphaproteobacteria bacterium]
MADGFKVIESLDHAPQGVWACLTDFDNASEWMTGIADFTQVTQGPLEIGTRFRFMARGKQRETRVTALDPGKRIALTSTQGGVTATYTYSATPAGDGTEVTLKAVCNATGFCTLIHPVIVLAMKKSDSSQLANLKLAMGRLASDHHQSQVT